MLKAKYESKVEWVARQIKDSSNQIGRLNILNSYYHDFIKPEAQNQDTSMVIWALSGHAVAKEFAQRMGLRATSDTNITKYEHLWSILSNVRSSSIQHLISEFEIDWTSHQLGRIVDNNVTTRIIYIYTMTECGNERPV